MIHKISKIGYLETFLNYKYVVVGVFGIKGYKNSMDLIWIKINRITGNNFNRPIYISTRNKEF